LQFFAGDGGISHSAAAIRFLSATCHCESSPRSEREGFASRREDGLRRPLSFNSERKGKRTPTKTTFLHFLPRYTSYQFAAACHAFAGSFSISYRHRTLSATAPLPLVPSTVEPQALFITPANSSGARLLRVSLRASSQTGAGSDPSAGQ